MNEKKWVFAAAYDSVKVDEQAITRMVGEWNALRTRYVYRYRAGRGTTDWIVEKQRV